MALLQGQQLLLAAFEAGKLGRGGEQLGEIALGALGGVFGGAAAIYVGCVQVGDQAQHLPKRRIAAQFVAADGDAFVELAAIEQHRNDQPHQRKHADDAEFSGDGQVVPTAGPAAWGRWNGLRRQRG